MNVKSLHTVYFIGVGGIGMSALARYFNMSKKRVIGYDKTPSPVTDQLIEEGIEIHFDEDLKLAQRIATDLTEEDLLVVYTPAIPSDNEELAWFKSSKYEVMKRSKVLGLITESGKTIAVAGTHGKTTTSTIIAHLLHHSGIGCNAFLGGIAANYRSNFLYAGKEAWNVVEADEYDRSFLALSPNISVITSMDPDHLDIYGTAAEMTKSYKEFAQLLPKEGILFTAEGVANLGLDERKYGTKTNCTISAINIDYSQQVSTFDYIRKGKLTYSKLTLPLPGKHNVENTLVAIAIAEELGITESALREALSTFKGIRRRFEYHIETEDLVYIDDYAHHPSELAATIAAAKEKHPGKKLTGVFQPHLFSRTKDFAEDFAKELGKLDEIILLDIYPAREKPIPGIDSQWLLDKIPNDHKKHVSKSQLLLELQQRDIEVLLTLGAGDIDRCILPIKNWLSDK
ncbi:MAG: UDP-N-acetylmuramate--alanine ligase [Flavobacteriales bacterium]|jgi:UDP-N-acetylmuramate--alanine ligase